MGLRMNILSTINNDDVFISAWNNILTDCSMNLMWLIVEKCNALCVEVNNHICNILLYTFVTHDHFSKLNKKDTLEAQKN